MCTISNVTKIVGNDDINAIIVEQSLTLNCIQMRRALSGNVLHLGKIGHIYTYLPLFMIHINNLVLFKIIRTISYVKNRKIATLKKLADSNNFSIRIK